jgi:hypothetical protein
MKADIYQKITDQIVSELEKGVRPMRIDPPDRPMPRRVYEVDSQVRGILKTCSIAMHFSCACGWRRTRLS